VTGSAISYATLGEAVESAERQFIDAGLFFGHGSASAYDEAAYLVLHTLALPLDDLESVWERRLTGGEQQKLTHIVQRRITERVPAAYLTREAWLGPYRFYVDERVIVPRSFIAELMYDELSPWVADPANVRSVLDLCTGSGCLAIVAALTFENAKVDAADLSTDALAVAERNVGDYELNGRVKLVASDMFGALDDRRYDLIISNPPYVTGESMAALPEEYLREPQMALASGKDGLDHVRTILQQAPQHLNEGGLLVVEVGFNRHGVEAAFPHIPFTWAEVSAGDEIVFLISREELLDAA
jgi:ribosomal protein L3 glutamine methyltransferase